jgi:hypothetical protein
VFLFCQYASEVWQEIKKSFPIQLKRSCFVNVKEWTFDFLERSTEIQKVLLAVTLWHLWDARNGVRNGDAMRHPDSLARKIKTYVEMIDIHLLGSGTDHIRVTITPTSHWSPPPEGTIFVNVDDALFSFSAKMGVGVVFRDHRDRCLIACSHVFDAVTTAELAETLAVRRAIALAREEGFDRIILLSPDFSQIRRWAVIEMGLEDMHMKRL